ncbi:unnamed protein product [Hapterophycus canaliculatus]
MQGSASARALGSSRESAGGGLAARKEQVQKEIQEQRALIEKLEGRVASLSGRERRYTRPRASSGSPASKDGDRDACRGKQGTDDRPAITLEPESVAAGQNGDIEVASDGQSGRARTGSHSNIERASQGEEVADHGPSARHETHHAASRSNPATPPDQQREEVCAVAIQRNVRGIGRRKRFLTLQSAREELECHLQALVSTTARTSAQQQQQQGQRPRIGAEVVREKGAREGSMMTVSSAAVRLLETSRKDGLAKPPFEILRALYRGIDDVAAAVASISSAQETGQVGAGGDGAHRDSVTDRKIWAATVAESCSTAKEAIDAVREAIGPETKGVGGTSCLRGPAPSFSAAVDRDQHNSPAGSGRAAAVAMASARGGLLVCADDLPTMCQSTLAEGSSRGGTEIRKNNERHDRNDRNEKRHPQSVPLRSLDVSGVAQLLHVHGFEEQVPGFVSQSVDGVMLSDPNLCEADFAELGLGGGEADATHDCRLRMVSFFRRSQQEGVLLQLGTDSTPPFEGGLDSKSKGRHAGESIADDRRGNESSAGRKLEMGMGTGSPDRTGSGQLTTSEELSWRRGSGLVDRNNQRVLAQIALDPCEAGAKDKPAYADAGGDRRLSVKLNQGVVITAGGRKTGLIDNTVDELEAAEFGAAAEEESKALAATPSGEASRANTRRRRTSVGIPTVTLYREAGDVVGPETGGRPLPLPPDVVVTTADETINVFR